MIYFVSQQTSLDLQLEIQRASVEDVFNYFKDKQYIGLDTETTGFNPYKSKLLSIQLGDYQNQFVIDCSTIDVGLFKGLLEDQSKVFVLHNAKFDLRFFLHKGISVQNVFDTFLAERILTNGHPRHIARLSLDFCVQKYLKVSLDKDIRGLIHRLGLVPRVIKYAADDVRYSVPLMEKQKKKLLYEDLMMAVKVDNAYVRVLAYTEYVGFKLDVNRWKQKMAKDLANLKASKDALDKWVIENNHFEFIQTQLDLFDSSLKCSINWSSTDQTLPLMKKLGVNVEIEDPEDKDKMKESLDAKVLQSQLDVSPVVELYLDYKKYEKLVGTYGQNWLDQIEPATQRIHTSFTQLMDTGRLSSGGSNRATGEKYVNFQNIPSDAETRSCFIAEEGNTLVVADYSGQEQIVLANKSQDEDIIKFYERKLGDMHSFVASKIFPELSDLPLKQIKADHKDKRQIAKAAGFAINYGGTGFTIARNLNISREEGDAVYEAYFKAFPGLQKYFKSVQDKALTTGTIIFNELTKRKYYVPYFRQFKELESDFTSEFWEEYRMHKEAESEYYEQVLKPKVRSYFKTKGNIGRKALNFPIQGTSADMTKIAGILFFRWLERQDLLFIVKIPNFVHDEIVVECPQFMAEEVASVLQKCMEKAGEMFCKTVEIKAEPCITPHWQK